MMYSNAIIVGFACMSPVDNIHVTGDKGIAIIMRHIKWGIEWDGARSSQNKIWGGARGSQNEIWDGGGTMSLQIVDSNFK